MAVLLASAEISSDVVPYLNADGKTRTSLGTVHLSVHVLGQKSLAQFSVILGFDWCMQQSVALFFNANTRYAFVKSSDIKGPEHVGLYESSKEVLGRRNCNLLKVSLCFVLRNQTVLPASAAVWVEIFVLCNKLVDTYLFEPRISSAPDAQYISP